MISDWRIPLAGFILGLSASSTYGLKQRQNRSNGDPLPVQQEHAQDPSDPVEELVPELLAPPGPEPTSGKPQLVGETARRQAELLPDEPTDSTPSDSTQVEVPVKQPAPTPVPDLQKRTSDEVYVRRYEGATFNEMKYALSELRREANLILSREMKQQVELGNAREVDWEDAWTEEVSYENSLRANYFDPKVDKNYIVELQRSTSPDYFTMMDEVLWLEREVQKPQPEEKQ